MVEAEMSVLFHSPWDSYDWLIKKSILIYTLQSTATNFDV